MLTLLKAEMLEIGRLCYQRNLVVATSGNISIKSPDGKGILIKASGVCFAHQTEQDIVTVGWDGSIIEADTGKKPSIETELHLAVYEACPDVRAVVHLHPLYTTVLSTLYPVIPLLGAEISGGIQRLPVVPALPAGSVELAESVRAAFSEGETVRSVVLAGHGIVAAGKNLKEAYYRAEFMERNSHVVYLKNAITETK